MTRADESTQGQLVPPQTWRRPHAHLHEALTHPWYRLLALVQSALCTTTHQFWLARGVHSLMLPVTTGSVSSPMGLGSDSLPVDIELHGRRTHLADSMQFSLEYGCRVLGTGCYYLMPSFRGEENDASHLGEFFHSEAEVVGTLDDIMCLVEDHLSALATGLLDAVAPELAARAGTAHLERLAAGAAPVYRISFDEAAAALADVPGAIIQHEGWRDLSRAGERLLLERVGEFVWVTHWDELAVPFYQATDGSGRAFNADLLFGIGEVVGAGERALTGADLRFALARHGVDGGSYDWYARMKDLQPLRTAGFGMGVERFLAWALQHHDVRDLQLLLRGRGVEGVP